MKFDPSLPIYKSLKYRLGEAFKEGPNLVALAGFVAASAATLNPIPLLVGLVAEAVYLLFVPDSKWYEKRIQARFDGEVVERREALKAQTFPIVRKEIRHEFSRLEQVRSQIEGQSRGEEGWFREAMRKLDFLMEKYLQFAQKEAQFASYLMSVYAEVYEKIPAADRRSVTPPMMMGSAPPKTRKGERNDDETPDSAALNPSPEWVEEVAFTISSYYEYELRSLEESIQSETVVANQNLMSKRQQILNRRKEFITRVSQIMSNLGLQMRLMADTFGLINDEIRARSPEQVLSDIDDVIIQATSLTEAIDEITPMTEIVANLS